MNWGEIGGVLTEVLREALLAALMGVATVLVNTLMRLLSGKVERSHPQDDLYAPDW